MKKICFVVSSETTAKAFLLDQIAALSRTCLVSVVANTRDRHFLKKVGIKAEVLPVPIERKISPLRDTRALFRLIRVLWVNRFDLVHSISPKAGLLSMIGGSLSRIPIRIHTFTGQVWATRGGMERWLLRNADRLLASLATHILVDSDSQRRFLIEEKVIAADKSSVLGCGSISGVDTARFRPNAGTRAAVRLENSIAEGSVVFLYLGRLNRDKGLLDLAEAFSRVHSGNAQAHLLIVGPDEEDLLPRIRNICSSCVSSVHVVGYTDAPERYMAAADVFCLPSYREGFGSVIIEAAAAGIPAIASRIYGITDAVEDRITGLLHEPGNAYQISDLMEQLIGEPQLRKEMGDRARERALRDFPKEKVTSALLDHHRKLMEQSPGYIL